MRDEDTVIGTLLEDACLNLEELASACAVNRQWVIDHIEEGLIEAAGSTSEDWRFSSVTVQRVLRMRAIERDFDAVPELAAFVADVLEEIDQLRDRLRRAGLE